MEDEEREDQHAYLFLLKRDFDSGKLLMDTFADVSLALGDNAKIEQVRAMMTKTPVDGRLAQIPDTVRFVELRARMDTNTSGPYLVHTSGPVEPEVIEGYLNSLAKKDFNHWKTKAKFNSGIIIQG